MNKGIIYCRVSSQEQTHGTSLENQQRACIEYAEKKGIKVAKIFVERGESATAANRTELIKVLDYCKENKGEITAFIVWKLDRFARNLTDHYGLQAQLLKYGTTLHSVTEEIISEGPIGKMMEAVLAGYAQFENDIRKQRCEGGLRARLRDGIRPWEPPIGYVNSKLRKDTRRKLVPDVPDSERFLLIQRGLRLYMEGRHTIVQLTDESNQWGLRTRTGKPMRKQLWDRILVDKFYAGILVDRWTSEEHRGLHKPMISIEEFEQIQRVKRGLSNNAAHTRLLYHPDFPLRGTVRCGCGELVTAGWQTGRGGKKYPYYRCHNRACTGKVGISKTSLEEKFAAYLEHITPDERFLQMFEKILLDEWKNEHMNAALEKDRYEKMVAKLEARKLELREMRANKEISKEEYSEMRDATENQLLALSISRNEALTNELDLEASIEYGMQFIRNVARQWQDLTDPAQRMRLQILVLPEGIVYDKNTGRFCTAVLSPVFKLFQEFSDSKSDLVAGAGIAPATSRLCIPLRFSPLQLQF